MKREVMTKAWELFKKGFKGTFSECLKAAWNLVKRIRVVTTLQQEELNIMMKNDKNFRHRANKSNLSSNVIYHGEGKVYFSNFKFWIKSGIARIYADKMIDGIIIKNTYFEVK